ncbi:MAG TPA: hypothetical protein VFO44_19035 [Steroidobacteraceae bacterium]|nr:hypothetical protein [Steroidobacteraceae bacterium]
MAPAPRLPKQLRVRPHAMEGHRAPTDSIDEHEVSSEVAFREATPVLATLSESMLAEGRWEPFAGDQGVEYIFERLRVELYVLTGVSVIALEAREND